jgi:hypothetical protein
LTSVFFLVSPHSLRVSSWWIPQFMSKPLLDLNVCLSTQTISWKMLISCSLRISSCCS